MFYDVVDRQWIGGHDVIARKYSDIECDCWVIVDITIVNPDVSRYRIIRRQDT